MTGKSWAPVIEAAAGRTPLGDGRFAAPDIRGHGTSSAAQPITLEAVVGDVAELISPGATVAGYSMGGRIALHVALFLGARVKRLVLIGASPGIGDARERKERRLADERLAEELEQLPIDQLADRWALHAQHVLAGQSDRVRALAHADRLRNEPDALARALRALGPGALPQLWDRLGELRMPVVLVVGEHDLKFRLIAEQMAERIVECRVRVVQGTGHAVHLEAPDAIADEL